MGIRIASATMLLLTACGDASPTQEPTPNESAAAMANSAEPQGSARPGAAGAANVALGRWVQESGNCDEMADVEFTDAAVRMFGGPGEESMDIPLTYRDHTPTSVTMQAEPGQPSIVATLRDPNHLVLTSPGRPERECTLVRR